MQNLPPNAFCRPNRYSFESGGGQFFPLCPYRLIFIDNGEGMDSDATGNGDQNANIVLEPRSSSGPSSPSIETHRDRRTWFLSPCDGREEAEKHLLGSADGTFLIRDSSKGGFALSIVADDKVHHC